MCLYEKINELCKQKGVSIYKMCKDTGIAQNVVSNWQNRPDAEPSLKNAVVLAKYFKVKAEYFLKE